MKKFFALLFLILFFIPLVFIRADELENITRELEGLKKDLANKEANYQQLNLKLNNIKSRVSFIEEEIQKKEIEVKKGEKVLEYQKNLLNERARSYYKNANKNSVNLLNVLTSGNLSESLRDFFYQKTVVDQDKNTIIKIVLYIKNLEKLKLNLEEEKNKLTLLKSEIDNQSKILNQQIAHTRSKIAQLSARQQELIAKKFASNPLPRSAGSSLGGCKPDFDPLNNQVIKDPGFSPKFGFFSVGVPNKVGMNQYGAYGRAKTGQDFRQILSAYYQNVRFECQNFKDNKIKVQGYGEMNIKDYLKGLSEMHRNRDDVYEAFKAQVVAAASYAYNYTKGGNNEICPTENCQVYRGFCNDCNSWNRAVDEVNKECGEGVLVMVSNDTNDVITAWYSSTHGGVMLKSDEIGWGGRPWTKHGFDTNSSVNSLRDLLLNAYDGPNFANSPWFYCNWGYRKNFNNSAWLSESEVLEVVNALILFELDNSTFSHLSQVDKDIPETWNDIQVREEIKKRGGYYFSSISSIDVVWDGSGISRTIIIRGDIGEKQFNAQRFKDIFNLRARENLVILPACLITKSSEVGNCKNYALFDVINR